jgi:hypothetical protein
VQSGYKGLYWFGQEWPYVQWVLLLLVLPYTGSVRPDPRRRLGLWRLELSPMNWVRVNGREYRSNRGVGFSLSD